MITFRHKGDFSKLTRYFERVKNAARLDSLERYGELGVAALSSATPFDTGLTSKSWNYIVKRYRGGAKIQFMNTNIQDGVPIAIILQYGHATKNGGWIEGRDYINPAIQPIFDRLLDDAWREVTKD